MPELPEVETIARELESSGIRGKTIKDISVYWERTLSPYTVSEFRRKILGQKITSISRRGKLLIFALEDYYLLVHLRMTGKFSFSANGEHFAHERIRLLLSDGRVLSFQDQRKFGRWSLAEDLEEGTSHLGVEPLSDSFTEKFLEKSVKGRKTAIKAFLLSQHCVAGLGNIYVDEALYASGIHPLRQTGSLTSDDIKRLHSSIIKVLEKGIRNQGTTLGAHLANYYSVSGRRGRNQDRLKVFRREGETCEQCGATIQKIRVAQRGTHFCPTCQPLVTS